jgi:hypothetical protein
MFLEMPEKFWELCESPIERMLVGGLVACHDMGRVRLRFLTDDHVATDLEAILDGREEWAGYRGAFLHIFPQAKLGRYRVDFLVVASGNLARMDEPVSIGHRVFIVECDGREFHQDKWADERRDSHFWSEAGFPTIRFPGRDIFIGPSRCARAVIDFAYHQLWQSEKDLWWHGGIWGEAAAPEAEGLVPFAQCLMAAIDIAEWNYFAQAVQS